MIHCYSYSLEMAREYVKMGYYIGVGGVVTFKNSKKLKEIVEEIPLESIVLRQTARIWHRHRSEGREIHPCTCHML